MYAILKGYKFSVGKIIENSILSYFRSSYKGLIRHPKTVTRLCILGGVEGDWEEEETCPKASRLTLTGVTKGTKNRGKEKKTETEEEERDGRENELVQLESPAQEWQGNLSPIRNVSLDVREIHQEAAESSRNQSNNTELMEMLKVIRQEMQERDRRLKVQLQLRDEYMDTKLRRRDQNLEIALKQRDEEWRDKIDRREE